MMNTFNVHYISYRNIYIEYDVQVTRHFAGDFIYLSTMNDTNDPSSSVRVTGQFCNSFILTTLMYINSLIEYNIQKCICTSNRSLFCAAGRASFEEHSIIYSHEAFYGPTRASKVPKLGTIMEPCTQVFG